MADPSFHKAETAVSRLQKPPHGPAEMAAAVVACGVSLRCPLSLMRLLLLILAAAPLLAGCAAQKQLIADQQRALDSLQAANAHLAGEIVVLQDSLQFFDDIDSGQYRREQREMERRIDKLVYDLSVCRDGGQELDVLLVDELFEPATATLTARGQAALDALAARLAERDPEGPLRVEGYTDSVPVGASLRERFPSNWELSAARASAVVRYLIDAHAFAPERLQAVGYGPTHPVATNETAAGRRQNRRIRFVALAGGAL